MEETVNERIRDVMECFGYRSVRAFATKIGIAPTSLNDVIRKGAEPKFSTLSKILEAEPLLSAEWLLRGKGEMKLSGETPSEEFIHSFASHLDKLEKEVLNTKEELESMKEKIFMALGENEYLRQQLTNQKNSAKGAG